jgi:hypothetical protein
MTTARVIMIPISAASISFMILVFECGILYPERVGLAGCRMLIPLPE